MALALVVTVASTRGPALAAVAATAGSHEPVGGDAWQHRDLVWIPPGTYQPLYTPPPLDSSRTRLLGPARRVSVPAFWLATHAVTNAEYLEFVREHPEWRRSRARGLFVDDGYLRHWRGDLDLGDPALAESPVVNVSWFAARAYCASRGHQLPTVDQWEYAASASERAADATGDPRFQERLVGSSRVDLQACKLEYSIVSPK